MRKNFTLTFLAVMLSFASFAAVGPILGTLSACVGGTSTLADTSLGGVWFSSNTNVATVGSTTGVVSGLTAGTTTITYYKSGSTATATFVVNPLPKTITGTKSVCVGTYTCLTDSTSGGVWSASSTVLASVGSTTGCVYAASSGVVTITYKLTTGCYSTTNVTINPAPGTISGPGTVCVGSTIMLSDPTSGGVWSSSSSATASVSSAGVVTGNSAGTVNISYTLPTGCYAYKTVTVTTGASISGPSTVCTSGTITLVGTPSGGTWSCGATSIATVTSGGLVSGVSTGVTNIYYSAGGCNAYHTVTVTSGAGTISGPSSICVGSTGTMSSSVSGGTWISSDTTKAKISTSGVVTGMSTGTAIISYYLSGCLSTKTVTITTGSGTITGPSSVCVGSTITLSSSSSGGTWISGGTSIATVSTSGVVTGVSAGAILISYYLSGCISTTTVTVTSGATISGASSVCIGSTTTLVGSPSGGTWSCGSTSTATVSSGGVVTGVATGVTNIYYSVGGCFAYHTVTVTSGGGTISGPSSICVGSTGTMSSSVSGGTWISSDTTKAKISTGGVITGMSTGAVTITYYISGCISTKSVSITPGPATITGPSSLCVGSTMTLSDSTSGGSWFSSNTAVAIITSTGFVYGISSGTAIITYYASGCMATKTITVNPAPAAITGPSSVCVGGSITLMDATTGGSWYSSYTTVSVNPTSGSVTGMSVGTAMITYYAGGCYATKTVSVVSGPSSISGSSSVCNGATITLSDATTGGIWSSSDTLKAKISTGGVVSGISAGVVTITYTVGSCFATKTVTVTGGSAITGPSSVCTGSSITLSNATPGGIWLTSSTAIATVGSGTGIVTGVTPGVVNIYYAVGGCYAYHVVSVTGSASISGPTSVCTGSTITLSSSTTGGSWSSSNSSIATVSGSGVVTGMGAGTVIISYTIGSCSATKMITVAGGSSSISGPTSICTGTTTTYSASVGGGSWLCSSTTIATIGSTGVVTGVSSGVVNIYYILGSCYAYKTVTVYATPSISGPSAVCTGSTITMSTGTTGGSWTSSAPSIATVGSTGVVTGVSGGVATISYSVGSCSATKTVTVTGSSSIAGPSTVCTGSVITLSASPGGGSWYTGSSSIATVGSTGVVTGVGSGVTNIYYNLGGCYAYHTVTVTGGGSISGPSTVCAGSTITMSCSPTGGTWLSGNTSIATISTSGVVTGVGAGVVNIYYNLGGCGAYKTVTVNATPSAIGGPTTVAVGSTITLSDAVPGGAWLSSNTSIGTISSSGVVRGVSAGIINIYYIIGGCGTYLRVTVTTPPSGMISGDITSGGAKGTSGSTPEVGMAVNLYNAGSLVATVNTDVNGIYTFEGLEDGNYIVSPHEDGFTTIQSPALIINSAVNYIPGVNFHKYQSSKTISPYGPSVIANVETNGTMSIFPNPSNGLLNVNWTNQNTGSADVIVTDVLGKEVYRNRITLSGPNGETQLGLSELKNGIYLFVVQSDEIYYSARLVIQQ